MDWKTRIPGLSGNADVDMKRVLDYSFQLSEEIRYYLNNLDLNNFNQVEWAQYENGLLEIAAEEMTLQLGTLEAVFEEEIDGLGQWMTEIEATAEGIQTTVQGHATSISSLNTKTTSLQSQITQTSNKISAVVSAVDDTSGNVTAASIVAAINAAGSTVKISADHIVMSGVVTVEDLAGEGTVEINAGNIVAGGTISGVALESTGRNSWEEISVHDGMVEFYSGYIKDADLGILNVYANQALYMETDGYVYLFVGGRGKCWRIGSDGIYFCNNRTMTPTSYVVTTTLE